MQAHGQTQLIYQEEDWDSVGETTSGLYFCHEGKRNNGSRLPFASMVHVKAQDSGVQSWDAVLEKTWNLLSHQTGSAFLEWACTVSKEMDHICVLYQMTSWKTTLKLLGQMQERRSHLPHQHKSEVFTPPRKKVKEECGASVRTAAVDYHITKTDVHLR